jgi:tetrahydromethanopterin S-methyltransferase subunit G
MAEMTAQEAAEWGKTLDFPTVWAALMETRERFAEVGARLDQVGVEVGAKFAEVGARLDQMGARVDQTTENVNRMGARVDQTTENVNKMAERVDRITQNVGGLNHSVGELVEILVAARLWEKFPEYGLQRAYRRLPLYDAKNEAKAEIDILLVNTEWAMAVEVKREADTKDVDHHLERMARILKYPPAQLVPGVKLLGAVAGGIVTPEAKEAAHEAGFYVLELAGESVIRVPDPPGFKPKEWEFRG